MPHIHEKIDFTVEVFVVYKNTVLLRKHDKYKFWLSVGGHVELDEDPNQAAIREVKEETGLDIELVGAIPDTKENLDGYKELMPPRFLNIHKITESHRHLAMTYFAKTENKEIVQNKEELSDEIRWFTKEELDNPAYGIRESIKHYAKTALQELF